MLDHDTPRLQHADGPDAADVAPRAPDEVSSDRPKWRSRARGGAWPFAVLLVFFVLVATGITTTSVGVTSLREDPSNLPPGLIAFAPDSIRSDEFLRGTPRNIGRMLTGGDEFLTPLSYHDHANVSGLGKWLNTVIHLDRWLATQLAKVNLEAGFAAQWWFPAVLVLLLLPRWFARLGAGPWVSLPLGIVLVFSPFTVWWSWVPLASLAFALLAAEAAAMAVDRVRRPRGGWTRYLVVGLLVVLAALAATRLAQTYQPWAIPLAMFVIVPIFVLAIRRGPRMWTGVALAVGIATLAASTLAAYLWLHAGRLESMTGTVYPGSRRESGEFTDLVVTFGAPHMWILQAGPALTSGNPSELSSSYTLLALAALLLVPFVAWNAIPHRKAALVSFGVVSVPLAAWFLVDLPEWTAEVPVMSIIPVKRMAQLAGYGAVLAFGAVLAAAVSSPRTREMRLPAGVIGLVVFVVTAVSGSEFRQVRYPIMETEHIALASAAFGGVTWAAIRFAGRWYALVPLALFAFMSTVTVSPIQRGFANLRTGDTAERIRALASEEPAGRWATGDMYIDALLMANGVPVLSGQQSQGPNQQNWELLDPERAFEGRWNRGASYVVFNWVKEGTPTLIENPTPDTIRVSIDPCDQSLRGLDMSWLVSTAPISASCIDHRGTLTLGGREVNVYERLDDDESERA